MSKSVRPSSQKLLDIYSTDLSMAAQLHAREHDLKTNEVVGVVADLRTKLGRQTMRQIAQLSKGDAERVWLEPDVNEISLSDQQHVITVLVRKEALSEMATVLRKEYGDRKGAIVVTAGRDGLKFSQERESLS